MECRYSNYFGTLDVPILSLRAEEAARCLRCSATPVLLVGCPAVLVPGRRRAVLPGVCPARPPSIPECPDI